MSRKISPGEADRVYFKKIHRNIFSRIGVIDCGVLDERAGVVDSPKGQKFKFITRPLNLDRIWEAGTYLGSRL